MGWGGIIKGRKEKKYTECRGIIAARGQDLTVQQRGFVMHSQKKKKKISEGDFPGQRLRSGYLGLIASDDPGLKTL